MGNSKGPVVSVINLKGGVGKSTIAVLLSRFAAEQGRKVLAVDLDPQANLSQAFMRSTYRKFLKDKDPSIVEVFRGYRPPSSSGGSPRPLDPADVVRRVGSGKSDISLVPSRFDFADNLVKSLMRGKFSHLGNAWDFRLFGDEFVQRLDSLERGATP